jgi:protein-tyrosine phosphatase
MTTALDEPGQGRAVTLEIAFVCTGNRYRSVLAEAIFRKAVEGLPVRVGSFGTLDVGNAGPLPEAVEAARGLGLDISAHAARCVAGADLSQTALVLGFERAHAASAVASAGASPERTFMLLELLELLELLDGVDPEPDADPVARALGRIERAHALRRAAPRALRPTEIEDPLGRPTPRQQEISHEVYLAVTRLAEKLLDVPTTAGGG